MNKQCLLEHSTAHNNVSVGPQRGKEEKELLDHGGEVRLLVGTDNNGPECFHELCKNHAVVPHQAHCFSVGKNGCCEVFRDARALVWVCPREGAANRGLSTLLRSG